MTDEKAIEVIKENCYRLNPMDLDGMVQVNQALDRAVEALQSAADAQEIIRKFRELQQKALKKGYTQNGGYCRGVTDCLRIMLNEYELGKADSKQRWIPVSERLPEAMNESNGEYSDDVLICVADDDEHITISTGYYGYYPNSKSLQGWWNVWDRGCCPLDSKCRIVAWMPLPEAYKAESEEV